MSTRPDLSVHLYRRLLRLFPAAHRAQYGDLMQQLFEDQLAEAGPGRPRMRLWARTLSDTLASAALEHLDRWSEPMRTHERALLAAAAVLLVVPLAFVVLNLLQYGLHIPLPWNFHDILWPRIRWTVWSYVYDAVIVFSAPSALLLLLLRQLQVRWRPQADQLALLVVSKGDRLGLALMLLCLLLMGTMGLYFLGENLPCLLGQQVTC